MASWIKLATRIPAPNYRKHKRALTYGIRVFIFCTVLWLCSSHFTDFVAYAEASKSQKAAPEPVQAQASSRHLLSSVAWETCSFEEGPLQEVWVFIHALIILILFMGMAIICDDFFVPSLEVISERLELSEDVAGATFMAAGSSAPELFTSIAGMISASDIGIGTIVGSAVFNILIIVALSAALAGQVLHLDWRPLIRDSFFYGVSILIFIWFSWDNVFHWYEALVMLLLYVTYIVLMKFNPKLMDFMASWKLCCSTTVVPVDAESGSGANGNIDGAQTPDVNVGDAPVDPVPKHATDRKFSTISALSNGSQKHIFHHVKHGEFTGHLGNRRRSTAVALMHDLNMATLQSGVIHTPPTHRESIQDNTNVPNEPGQEQPPAGAAGTGEEEVEETINICPCLPCCPAINGGFPDSEEVHEKGGCLPWIKFILRWGLFCVSFPFMLIFTWTIPDCSKEHLKKYYLVSFGASIFWIAMLSFGIVTLVARIGCIVGIDSFSMGLVIIAVGTSIPDALSSILVARDGFGDMAVSNAIGSNVFDINLGLGLPFLVRILITQEPIHLLSATDDSKLLEMIEAGRTIMPHAKFGFILLFLLFLILLIFFFSGFKMGKFLGISFVCLYVSFLIYAFINEFVCDDLC